MSIFKKIKDIVVKPEVHPETHHEKVEKIIDDVCRNGLKKGLKKSEVEIESITKLDKDAFKDMVEPSIKLLSKPGEYTSLAMVSDSLNMALDDDKKTRLRLPENALDALAVCQQMESLRVIEPEELNHALRTIFGYYFILPGHSEQVEAYIKDICKSGLKKATKSRELEIGYLTRMTPAEFIDLINNKLDNFVAGAHNKLVPETTDMLGMNLSEDEKKRFRLSDKALEAFASLLELKNLTQITEEENHNALKEIFSNSYFLPTHDKQVGKVIEEVCDHGFEKGIDRVKEEIQYLTDMQPEKFKNDCRLSIAMIKNQDMSEVMAKGIDLIGKNFTDDEKKRLYLKNDALEALGVLTYLSDKRFLWGDEETESLIAIFKKYKMKSEEKQ